VDYVCHPQYEADLHPHILAWANDRARSLLDTPSRRTCWFVSVFSGQDERIRDLEAAGFNSQADVGEDSWSKVLMRREGQLPPKTFAPPPGYVVRPLAGPDEVSAYVDLHQSVFESKAMTTTWRQRTLQHPAYRPDLDLVVQAPDGRLAAFCICWLSEDGESGQVEPLGCQKDFRRFALGRVALAAGLHRMRDLGIEQIFVETDNYRNTAFRLYESFDFQVIQDVLIYRKDYA
jgi:mycothiol synthase